ncbi:multidrug resistance protein, MATE family [Stigmatella aurantiaca]|uniref:Multidrug-efflux transporter n=1 Tax=Stigmatella aurantiaca TaxID=41 RepID=A0A1H7RXL6_STIAU|nr:MATE family efflux transporter [Stigmatella aurantiaca]SEL64137.1 multidrug resistance protein, MATE family [Stigmatella aurantiaca]
MSHLMQEPKRILQLGLPLIAAQFAHVAIVLTDTLLMGTLGTQGLAAGGLGAATFSTLHIVCVGVLTAISNIVAHAHGAQKDQDITQAVHGGFCMALLLACGCWLLLWNCKPILLGLGQSESTIDLARPYLRAIMWGIAPSLCYTVLRGFTVGLSRPVLIMTITLVAVVLNATLGYALMHGLMGLPALGLQGLGLSSTLVFCFMFASLALSTLRQPDLAAYRPFSGGLKFNSSMLIRILRQGMPIGIVYGIESSLFTVSAYFMGMLGTVPLAAHHIVTQCAYVTFMVPMGLSQATSMLISHSAGTRDIPLARRLGRTGLALGSLWTLMMTLVFFLMPERIVSFFIDPGQPDHAAVATLATQLLAIAGVFQLFDGSQEIAVGALRALEESRRALGITLISYCLLGIPLAYILGIFLDYGGVGIWWGLAAGLVSAAGLLVWCFERAISRLLSQFQSSSPSGQCTWGS